MRSYLYVPGDQPDKLRKALRLGADAIICDLEDAVAPDRKPVARSTVIEFLTELSARLESRPVEDGPAGMGWPQVWIRINSGRLGVEDLAELKESAALKPLAGVFVPKVNSVEELVVVDAALQRAEFGALLRANTIKVTALIETATGVLDSRIIAGGPRVVGLALGEADLSADIGVDLDPETETELLAVRSMVVLASAAAGIGAPIGPVCVDFRDLTALTRSSVALRRMGFVGRAAIHPAQVAPINAVFTPERDAVDRARRLVVSYDESLQRGGGVCVDEKGKMVDEAVVRSARRLIALSDRVEALGQPSSQTDSPLD